MSFVSGTLIGPDRRPATTDRALGALGIIGGAVLLFAFLPRLDIPSELNVGRLVLFNLGAIAVATGSLRTTLTGSASWAIAGAIAAIVANTGYLVMTLVSTTLERPFAGDFGVVYFAAGLAMWLADAWLGLALVRHTTTSRWGAIALTIGSLLAILGMDRIGLVSSSLAPVVMPVALSGVALNGLGWVLLGIALVRRPTAQSNA